MVRGKRGNDDTAMELMECTVPTREMRTAIKRAYYLAVYCTLRRDVARTRAADPDLLAAAISYVQCRRSLAADSTDRSSRNARGFFQGNGLHETAADERAWRALTQLRKLQEGAAGDRGESVDMSKFFKKSGEVAEAMKQDEELDESAMWNAEARFTPFATAEVFEVDDRNHVVAVKLVRFVAGTDEKGLAEENPSEWMPPKTVVVRVGSVVSTRLTANIMLRIEAFALSPKGMLLTLVPVDESKLDQGATLAVRELLPPIKGRGIMGSLKKRLEKDQWAVQATEITYVWDNAPGFSAQHDVGTSPRHSEVEAAAAVVEQEGEEEEKEASDTETPSDEEGEEAPKKRSAGSKRVSGRPAPKKGKTNDAKGVSHTQPVSQAPAHDSPRQPVAPVPAALQPQARDAAESVVEVVRELKEIVNAMGQSQTEILRFLREDHQQMRDLFGKLAFRR